MSEEFELRLDQWDALKALRVPAANPSRLNRFAVESLITLGYVAVRGDSFELTPAGRTVLVRGSSQLLLDIAA
ncbi:hypothetical protein HAP47_0030645 [Bradyrhizobium sp. 41S5]|uniref:hypothetical protein n=1 Tax=Bradyrhizobium sp. 41S5 TaxID=1404443 RepID=UPI00156AA34B|nr:hypothetical protein [Bradyrhizobium sp. 41S5]UFX43548.1 hypothetical protein HAP47_0030645 [Bradyrhizobium sp. 41S5]